MPDEELTAALRDYLWLAVQVFGPDQYKDDI
jgi:hypothetical protein